MEDIMKKLDMAYQRLMTIPVAGAHVEPMFETMVLLREAYAGLKEKKEGETDGQDH